MALMTIRDSKLYLMVNRTFEEYCKERWGFTRMRASQLISAVKVTDTVNNCLQKPTHESQLRPLTHLEPDEQKEVWKEAVETALNSIVTAHYSCRYIVRVERIPTEGMWLSKLLTIAPNCSILS